MVIYHAANASCFVKCLLHKCIYHAKDDAVFIGYEWLLKRFFSPDRYKQIIVYNPLLGPSGNSNGLSAPEVEEKIYELFEKLLQKNRVDIAQCKKIYIGSYYSEFAIYVNMKRINHCIFEEGAGDWNVMQWEGFETFNTIVKRLNMQDYNNNFVIERYGIFNTWPVSNRCEKDINFEAYKEIYKLCKEDKEYFIEKFKLPRLQFEEKNKNILLLTQWFMKNGEKWATEDVVKMYKIILDFYTEDNKHKVIYIKPHPADRLQNDYINIKDVTVISANCVSELLGLIEGINFDLAVTVSSSSLYTIEEFTKSTTQIGKRIIYSYNNVYKYYFAFVSLYDFLMYKKCYRYGVMNEDCDLVMKMPEASRIHFANEVQWRNWENAGDSMVIIQRMKWKEEQEKSVFRKEKLDYNTVCVFLNIEELLNYTVGDMNYLIENSVIFKARKIDVTTGLVLEGSEYILAFVKNPTIRQHLKSFGIKKSLKYEDIILDISALDASEEKVQKILLCERVKKI